MPNPVQRHLAGGAAALFAALPVSVHAASYGVNPITIGGASQVLVSAINNHSLMGGVYTDPTGNHGFIMSGGAVTILPPFCQGFNGTCIPAPTQITPGGAVGGTYDLGQGYGGFIWKNGTYLTSSVSLGSYNGVQPVFGVNDAGMVAFNYVVGDGIGYPYAGPYTAPAQIPGLGFAASVTSLNQAGEVAGTYIPFVGNTEIPCVFIVSGGKLTRVLPKGAVSASGGFLNNNHQLAGSYVDAAGTTRGFVYRVGKYTSFDLPKQASAIQVRAINRSGHVIGTYTDAARAVQRIFVYTGSGVNVFGAFPQADTVTLALNDEGQIVIADQGAAGAHSYRALCGGTGC
jgi:hypothetical protein